MGMKERLTKAELYAAVDRFLESKNTKYARGDAFIEGVRFAEEHHQIRWWRKMSGAKIRAAIANGPRQCESLHHINEFSRGGAFTEGVFTAERYHKIGGHGDDS